MLSYTTKEDSHWFLYLKSCTYKHELTLLHNYQPHFTINNTHTRCNHVGMTSFRHFLLFKPKLWTNQYKSSFNMYKYFGHRWLKSNCQSISPFFLEHCRNRKYSTAYWYHDNHCLFKVILFCPNICPKEMKSNEMTQNLPTRICKEEWKG